MEVENNKINGTIPTEYGTFSSISYLNLGQNALTGSLPSEVANIGNTLQSLNLGEL